MVFRYDDVGRVLSDPRTFSSRLEEPGEKNVFSMTLLSTDPPRHGQLRSLLNRAFTPSHVEALAPASPRSARNS